MSLGMQAKLLRALQERLIQRIGGTGYIPIDVRVIASCNEDAYALSETGKLRKDLFYRLASVVIDIPPLRERMSDLKELVWHYVREHRDMAAQPVDEIRPAFWERLEKHTWAGERAGAVSHHGLCPQRVGGGRAHRDGVPRVFSAPSADQAGASPGGGAGGNCPGQLPQL